MKKFFTLIASALIALSAMAEDQATYLIVGSNICSPITVKCSNGHTYKVYDQVRIEGLTQPREAYDCQGRQIVTPSGDTRQAAAITAIIIVIILSKRSTVPTAATAATATATAATGK